MKWEYPFRATQQKECGNRRRKKMDEVAEEDL